MKTYLSILFASWLLGAGTIWAAPSAVNQPAPTQEKNIPPPTPYAVTSKDANSSLWERTVYEVGPKGQVTPKKHSYTELATGLHYWSKGQWLDSQEMIDILPNGTAQAVQGQHQAYFPGDIFNGVIEVVTPDGQHMKSRPMGLSYYDGKNNVLIAELKDSVGVVVGDNQVIYPDAFTDFKADLRYTYTKAGFEQDVILREQPPAPETFGLNPQNTVLEVATEFFNTTDPVQAAASANSQDGRSDTTLTFGKMKMIRGKAFAFDDSTSSQSHFGGAMVYKSWQHPQGRTFLYEDVPVNKLTKQLQQLPPPANAVTTASADPVLHKVSATRLLTPLRVAQTGTNTVHLARADMNYKSGLVLDYVTVNASQTNFIFQGDSTYYISGDLNLAGATTIEGGTVIKLDMANASSLNILDSLNCNTKPYLPGTITSGNDNTVGESTSSPGAALCTGTFLLRVQNNESSDLQYVWVYDEDNGWNSVVDGEGSPEITSGNHKDYSFTAGLGTPYYFDSYDIYWDEFWIEYYPTLANGLITVNSDGSVSYTESGSTLCTPPTPSASIGLSLANGGYLHDLCIRNLTVGLDILSDSIALDAKFVNCGTAIKAEGASMYAGNILMSCIGTAFAGYNYGIQAENITFDQGNVLTDSSAGSSWLDLTNGLITGVGGLGNATLHTNHDVFLSTNSGIFQIVGAGGYYLATNSIYRNAGTVNIAAETRADLATKTTYPPIVYANITLPAANLSPQAQRDNDMPDLGYHYDPLDYVFGGCDLYTNMTFTPGTAVGWYMDYGGVYSSGQPYAFSLNNGANLTFNGTAGQPCYMAKVSTVQEGNGNWTGWGWMGAVMLNGSGSAPAPQLNCRFTKWCVLAAGSNHFRDNWAYGVGNFYGSEFYGNGLSSYWPSLYFTNCLFSRSYVSCWDTQDTPNFTFLNCTFYGAMLVLLHSSSQPSYASSVWTIKNTAFDGTALYMGDNYVGDTNHMVFGYNAYNSSSTNWMADYSSQFPFTNIPEAIWAHDLTNVVNFNWQSSWLGDFYLTNSSPLIDAGSTNANLLGLYHFTTQTNQMKETNSIVDIGYHYVAVDTNGIPIDTNGNGIPDYLDDSNGNGLVDSGEIGWNIVGDLGLNVIITQPRNGSFLP